MKNKKIKVCFLRKCDECLNTVTFDSLSDASEFVRVIEKRQGFKIGCPEEVAYRMNYIDKKALLQLAENFKKSGYGEYLKMVAG